MNTTMDSTTCTHTKAVFENIFSAKRLTFRGSTFFP